MVFSDAGMNLLKQYCTLAKQNKKLNILTYTKLQIFELPVLHPACLPAIRPRSILCWCMAIDVLHNKYGHIGFINRPLHHIVHQYSFFFFCDLLVIWKIYLPM